MVIPKVSLTRLSGPRAVVVRKKEEKPLASVYIPYVKGVSEKFKRKANQYNIKTIFKTPTSGRAPAMINANYKYNYQKL
jgi:hypothetical protein